MSIVMKRAGAGVPSANRITLLRDADGDGVAETAHGVPEGSATRRSAWRWSATISTSPTPTRWCASPTTKAQTEITGAGTKVADLPAGRLNHHWTKNLVASPDGTKLYASVGSNSNVAENGIEKEDSRAAILEIDVGERQVARVRVRPAQSDRHGVSSRRPARCGPSSTSATSSAAISCPDYLTSVKDGGFYGWPYSYFGQHVDARVQPPRPDLVAKAIVPDYALGTHVAPLGLTFAAGRRCRTQLPQRRLRRPARLVESQAAQRLQGRVRAVRGRHARAASRSTC